ncbi:hydrogenase maturation nickel metallochaperone HypA [Legionella worsleiensis]|uniref:Hydrogenase maturation factor HypA n=1 Tax=Legionella worsleiensis TaxID=45076 RepID=A0A0W1AAA7_9GAMM|nr:hydrogenase maturation nickel metallochaperone HypA [Legionella worsleiensis]KTD78274.1 hydrogenase nickel incorporation protein HypA [Legionella worsleiensis]STY32611.1 hydrogenase nickel incorporation protein HypA [Legionella worsleiensis]
MHELWLCKSILELITQEARELKCKQVKTIVLELGQLSAVDLDSLTLCFKVIAQGSVAQNAELRVIDVPGEAECYSCHAKVPVKQYYDDCPKCGSHSLGILQGEELRIKSMVVE